MQSHLSVFAFVASVTLAFLKPKYIVLHSVKVIGINIYHSTHRINLCAPSSKKKSFCKVQAEQFSSPSFEWNATKLLSYFHWIKVIPFKLRATAVLMRFLQNRKVLEICEEHIVFLFLLMSWGFFYHHIYTFLHTQFGNMSKLSVRWIIIVSLQLLIKLRTELTPRPEFPKFYLCNIYVPYKISPDLVSPIALFSYLKKILKGLILKSFVVTL